VGGERLVDALRWKTDDSGGPMRLLSGPGSWHVAGLSVDWFTGNVYVSDAEHQLIAVARHHIRHDDIYRVVVTSGLHRPTTLALDPYVG